MMCREYASWIALRAGGDLPPDEAAVLDAHLEECASCRALSQEMQQCCDALAELRDVPLMTVRAVVMERVAQPRWNWHGWWWIPATAALAGFAGWVVGLDTRTPPPPRMPLVRAALPGHALELRPKPKVPPVPWRAPELRTEESFVVKLITDDPDVVIYWLFDKKGD